MANKRMSTQQILRQIKQNLQPPKAAEPPKVLKVPSVPTVRLPTLPPRPQPLGVRRVL